MNHYFHHVFNLFDYVVHPAAGKPVSGKQKKRSNNAPVSPRATPDSIDIRDANKKQEGYRRNPAP